MLARQTSPDPLDVPSGTDLRNIPKVEISSRRCLRISNRGYDLETLSVSQIVRDRIPRTRNILGIRDLNEFDTIRKNERIGQPIRNYRFPSFEEAFLAHVSAWIARGYYARGGRSATFFGSSIDLYALYNNLI